MKDKHNIKKQNGNPVKADSAGEDHLDPGDSFADDAAGNDENISSEKLLITEEITELLSNEDLGKAAGKFNADSEDKEIALEFANSHIQFLSGIVESDQKKGVVRTDVEIRDLVSNVNILLQKKDNYLFSTIVIHSPSHYRNIQKQFISGTDKAGAAKA